MKFNLHRSPLGQALSLAGLLAAASPSSAQQFFTKPPWLPELGVGVTESYDNNIYGVSGNGLKPMGSWISTFSPRVGLDLAPLLHNQTVLQSLTLGYAPDINRFHALPKANFDAERFNAGIKLGAGNFSFVLNDSFLYNDGSKTAPVYALNQLSGAGANQLDKYRNSMAQAMVREELNQVQDRANATMRYDAGAVFIRPTASLLDYNLNTAWHNSSKAPYIGYQNYVDRSDINGGVDVGYKVMTNLALTLGFRYGGQYQEQFTPVITSDLHHSSSTYERVLLGMEGKPWRWLELSLRGGPDFRSFITNAPLANLHPTKYYGEASATVYITPTQNATFTYKQWEWVSSTGYVPEFDSAYGINYHWAATKRVGLELGGKIQQADYTGSQDYAGSAPSLRRDRMYTIAPAITYAFTSHLSGTLRYTLDSGNNELTTLPAADHAAYRNFIHELISFGINYKF